MARRCYGVFMVFLLKLMLGQCEESSEETVPKEVLGEEYVQIFHNIPTLFEYLLEMLEERPEILEKDDTTFFQEVLLDSAEGESKREVHVQCEDNLASDDDHNKAFKRNIATTRSSENNEDHVKITNDDNYSSEITTDVHKTESRDKLKDYNTEVSPKMKTKLNRNVKNKPKTKTKSGHTNNKGMKRNANIDDFIGSIDWNEFYLSPEVVEEQALEVEEIIEEHNKKVR